jgi:predicted O-methyltransferase YrrM
MGINEHTMNNQQNATFWKEIPAETLKDFAKRTGIENGEDVNALAQLINLQSSKRILEIGAGYGRVIARILSLGYTGELIAIERNPQYVELLRKTFSSRVHVVAKDLIEKDVAPKKPSDIILWMWSGIMDFNKQEQKAMIAKLKTMLSANGILVVETPKLGSIMNTTQQKDAQNVQLTVNYQTLHGYLPTSAELERIAKKAKFSKQENMSYTTQTQRERMLYLFHK